MIIRKNLFRGLSPRTFVTVFYTVGFTALAAVLLISCSALHTQEESYVVMLSLDGFRWDYPDRFPTQNLDRLARKGVKAEGLIPCFPTKTFPNHYSIVTGLYPDHHGIVQNSFYDPEMDMEFSISDCKSVTNADFYGGEPIWVTAEKQGVRTASYFWVGSEAPIEGIRPSIWKEYDPEVPFEARIDSVIAWLKLPPAVRPRLITMYMDEPDHTGHRLGPSDPELGRTIAYLDSLVGALADKLAALDIGPRINLIVTSDHGMGPVSPERYVDLADYLDTSWVERIIGYNPNYLVMAATGAYDSILAGLDRIPHVSGWPSGGVPERLVYGGNPRTLDFVLVADSAWSTGWREGPGMHLHGAHGYDNANTDMHAIFYARGPAFRSAYSQGRFPNTYIYALIASIMGLDPVPTDGNLEEVLPMLK
jgi:predicted AlkP superfamily pyrophosphatase or phosphodiesterase